MLIRKLTTLLAVATLVAPTVNAQQEHSGQVGKSETVSANTSHGGIVQKIGTIQVETVVAADGLRLFAYNPQGKPLDVRSARALATLQVPGNPKRYRYDLFPEVRQDDSAESLSVAVDLSQIAGQQIELAIQLVGIPAGEQRPAKFTAQAVVPMSQTQQIAAAIHKQDVCPVSGQSLGSMGKPIAVTVGDQTVYVCCASCIDAVKENPEKYLTAKPTLTVTPATEADAAAVAAQKVCPVMDEPLGGMGTPLKVTGLERDVFLCCKGCLKFLEKDPQKYLTKLAALSEPTNAPVVKSTKEDAPFIAAQKVCPVMDEPLGGMGTPYKTVVEGRVVYLCCPGCAKKLHADSAHYLAKLADHGVVPPLAR